MKFTIFIFVFLSAAASPAAELKIDLPDVPAISKQTAQFQCDANGVKLGVPASTFTVEYLNAGDNSLAIVPVHGKRMIFANVISGSGAKYAGGRLIWWDAGSRGTQLYVDLAESGPRAQCHQLP